MSDEKTVAQEQGDLGQAPAPAPAEEQLVNTPAGEGQEPGSSEEQEPKLITLEDAKALVRQEVGDAENRMRSYSDKGRIRAEKAADEAKQMVEQMRGYGREISDEEEAQIIATAKEKAEEDAYSAEGDDTETPAPAQAEVSAQYVAENLGAHDLRMQGKYGITLDPGDPETKDFTITGDPEKDKANVDAMYAAKAARLSSSSPNGETDNSKNDTSNAAVRVPGSTGQTPHKKLSSKQKLNKGLSDSWSQGKQ